MTTLRAHFDGKVFVPDEPVDLPAGKEVEVRAVHPSTDLPVFPAKPGGRKITLQDVKRAEEEEDLESFQKMFSNPITLEEVQRVDDKRPFFPVKAGAPTISSEDVRRAEDEF